MSPPTTAASVSAFEGFKTPPKEGELEAYTPALPMDSAAYQASVVASGSTAYRHRVTPMMTPRRLNLSSDEGMGGLDFGVCNFLSSSGVGGGEWGGGEGGICNFLGESHRETDIKPVQSKEFGTVTAPGGSYEGGNSLNARSSGLSLSLATATDFRELSRV